MRKIIILSGLMLLLLLTVFCGCTKQSETNEEQKTTVTTEETDPTSSEKDVKPGEMMELPCSKDDVAEFMIALRSLESDPQYNIDGMSEKNCYNVTPAQIAAQGKARIFKFSDSCEAWLFTDGKVMPLGAGFGGYGFVNAVLWDYDGNGTDDILYTYSWGSGIHRSEIAVMNMTTYENRLFYSTVQSYEIVSGDTGNDLFLGFRTDTKSCAVYAVDIRVTDGNFADLDCVLTDQYGSVVLDSGELIFQP